MENKNVYVVLFGAEKFIFLPKRSVSNDFRDLINLFTDKFDYQLRILFGNSFSRQNNWMKLIDELAHEVTNNDIVIIYYIGHAIELLRQNQTLYYLATPIGRKGSKKGGLEVNWVIKYPQTVLSAKSFLFIFDIYIGNIAQLSTDDGVFLPNNSVYVLSGQNTSSSNVDRLNEGGRSLMTHSFIKIMTDAYYLHKDLDVDQLYNAMKDQITSATNLSYGVELFSNNKNAKKEFFPLNLFRRGKYPKEITSSLHDDKGSREDGVIRLGQLLTDSQESMKTLAKQSLEYISHQDISDDVRVAALRVLGVLRDKDNIDRQLIETEFPAKDYVKHLPVFLSIPEGNFIIGCDNPSMPSEESPQHLLHLPEFQISRTQITNLQYAFFVSDTGYKLPYHWSDIRRLHEYNNHPVVNVSWYDAMAYCNWFTNKMQTMGLLDKQDIIRLPSEAEWEKAARGENGFAYPWGKNFLPEFCNFSENNIENTTPVDTYPHAASPYGCLDLAGNTWEWTLSLWGTSLHKCQFTYPYNPNDGRENIYADERYRRIIRGGGYYYGAECVTGYTRNHFRPNTYHTAGSFRVVLIRKTQQTS